MNKYLKRLFLVLLAIILLAQIPFIYRRYQTGLLAGRIAELQIHRVSRTDPDFKEYKGIIHAHTSLGGHSTGSFDELISAANANDLDFVLMTEHYSDVYDTSALTLNGVYGKTLFVGGNEIDTANGDRFLMIPGSAEAASLRNMPTTAVLEKLHSENRLALITYPKKFKSWDSNFDGDEVFSLHTIGKSINPLTAAGDLIWSFPAYPELTLASYFKRPDANLAKFDEIAATRKILLFAGTDAHSNIGFHLFGDDAGNKLLNIKIDRYETMFRLARTHVLIEKDKPLNRDTLIEAIKAGRFFVGFDVLGDTSGFSFEGTLGRDFSPMGSDLSMMPAAINEFPQGMLRGSSPNQARFVLFRNGEKVFEKADAWDFEFYPKQAGTYRIEVYRDKNGPPFDKMPWIFSNPIYVR
jgi:hypothetical protein